MTNYVSNELNSPFFPSSKNQIRNVYATDKNLFNDCFASFTLHMFNKMVKNGGRARHDFQ